MKSKDIDILCGVTLACAIIVSCGQLAIRNQPQPISIHHYDLPQDQPQYSGGVYQTVTLDDRVASTIRRHLDANN